MSRIVHLGLGNFHRAHQAVYTADAGDGWTITGVANRSHDVVDALREQGWRYHVVEIEGDDVSLKTVDVITDALVLADQGDEVVARIADANTTVVTLTVTEAGYRVGPSGGLDADDPAVRADLRGDRPPGTVVGALTRAVAARDGAPLALVSCDNLTGNGDVLRRVITDFADAAGLDLGEAVTFPSTMVDRIVPATTDRTIELVRSHGGGPDAVPVPAEPFKQWVLQPRFPAGRPAWEDAGAILSEDVHAWETVKVRLLNGSHSLIAYLGLLTGNRLIADAYADDHIRAAADLLGEEYVPTLRVPAELDVEDYRRQLGRRFANAALGHRCAQVGTDGSLKLAQRVPGAVGWWREHRRTPSALALLVASYLQCTLDPGSLPDGERPADPAADRIRATAARADDVARAVLTDEALLGEGLAADAAFVQRVEQVRDTLARHGVAAAVSAVTG